MPVKKKYKLNDVERLINKFGGLRAAAKNVRRSPGTVHRWRVNGIVPRTSFVVFKNAMSR